MSSPSNAASPFWAGLLAVVQMVQGFMELEQGATWDLDKVSNLMPAGGHAIAVTGYNKDGLFFCVLGRAKLHAMGDVGTYLRRKLRSAEPTELAGR